MCLNMEDSGGDFSVLEEDISLAQVILLQSSVRGWLVRKQLQELRTEYCQIFTNIEQNAKLEISWKRQRICLPQISRTRKQRPKKSAKTEDPEMVTQISRPGSQESIENDVTARLKPQGVQNSSFQETLEVLSVRSDAGSLIRDDSDTKFTDVDKSPAAGIDENLEFDKVSVRSAGSYSSDRSFGNAEIKYSTIETQTETSPRTDRSYGSTVENMDSKKIADEQPRQVKLHLNLESDQGSVSSQEQCSTDRSQRSESAERLVESPEFQATDLPERESVSSKASVSSKGDNSVTTENRPKGVHSPVISKSPIPVEQNRFEPYPQQQVGRDSGRDALNSRDRNSSTFTNETSVWDSFTSQRDSVMDPVNEIKASLPKDPEKLRELRKNVAMELLWVQQAISSRKNYLRLKQQL